MIGVFGATSSLAKSFIRQIAEEGEDVFLFARNERELEKIAIDTRIRYGVNVRTQTFDANLLEQHKNLKTQLKKCQGIILFHGYTHSKDGLDMKTENLITMSRVNYLSVITLTQNFAKKREGFIAVITSIAGDRGKKRNLVYSSAKAATQTYLQGLRQSTDLDVIDIRLGFVDTPMTHGTIKSNLMANRDKAAKGIIKAIKKRKKVAYVPWFWRYIMFVLKIIPTTLYDKLNL